jgi:hypothetical protein
MDEVKKAWTMDDLDAAAQAKDHTDEILKMLEELGVVTDVDRFGPSMFNCILTDNVLALDWTLNVWVKYTQVSRFQWRARTVLTKLLPIHIKKWLAEINGLREPISVINTRLRELEIPGKHGVLLQRRLYRG